MIDFKTLAFLSPLFVCGLLFIVFIIEGRRINPPKFAMGILMLIGFIFSASILVNQSGKYLVYSHLAPLFYSCLLSLAPLFYIYIRTLTVKDVYYKNYLWHLVPAAIYFIVSFILFQFLDNNERIYYITELNKGTLSYTGVFSLLNIVFVSNKLAFSVQVIVYFFLLLRELKRNRDLINNTFSGESKLTLNWLLIINIVFLIGGINGIVINLMPMENVNIDKLYLAYSLLLLAVFFLLLGIIAIRQRPIMQIVDKHDKELNEAKIDYNNELKLFEQLNNYMHSSRAFVKPELSIWDVAKELGTNRSYISAAINKGLGKNFNCYINSLRVEEVIKRIDKDTQEKDLKDLAIVCGFNSNSTFYRSFKNYVGKTPIEYLKSIKTS